jgi:hypothetical protein
MESFSAACRRRSTPGLQGDHTDRTSVPTLQATLAVMTVRTWDVGLDGGTVGQWSTAAERSPFVLQDGALLRRPAAPLDTRPARWQMFTSAGGNS